MNQIDWPVIKGFILLLCSILICFDVVWAGYPSMYENKEYKSELHNQKSQEEIKMDQLLGPDLDFPFRPENHRDNSNPIGRIGSISDENL